MIKMSSQRCSIIGPTSDVEKIYVIKEKGRSLEVKETMWRYYKSPQVDRKEGHLTKVSKQSKPDRSQSKFEDSKPGPNKPRRSERLEAKRLEAKRLKDAALH
jgi:hypothetical protein